MDDRGDCFKKVGLASKALTVLQAFFWRNLSQDQREAFTYFHSLTKVGSRRKFFFVLIVEKRLRYFGKNYSEGGERNFWSKVGFDTK